MTELLVLNGPPGVGKSTVASCVRNLREGTVLIDGDRLRSFTPQDARQHLGPGSTYRAAGSLTNAYASMGAQRIVFDYVFLSPGHVAHLRDVISPGVDVKLFTLWAQPDVVRQRERARISQPPVGSALLEAYGELEQNLDAMGIVIHTDALSPVEVAAEIDRLAAGRVDWVNSHFAELAAAPDGSRVGACLDRVVVRGRG